MTTLLYICIKQYLRLFTIWSHSFDCQLFPPLMGSQWTHQLCGPIEYVSVISDNLLLTLVDLMTWPVDR